MIDYWMVSEDLVKACEKPRILEHWAPRPHHPVRFELAAQPRRHRQLTLRAPKAFPRAHPSHVGCHPLEGTLEDRGYLGRVREDAQQGQPEDGGEAQGRLDSLYVDLIKGVEKDLCHIYQVDEPEQHCGREAGPVYSWRPVGGPAREGHPAAGSEPRYLRTLSIAIKD